MTKKYRFQSFLITPPGTLHKAGKRAILIVLLFLTISARVSANNIAVSNVNLTGRNTAAGTNNPSNFTLVQFDLSWNNSWRTSIPNNWDAAWVFVKFRLGNIDYLSAPGATNSGDTIKVRTTSGLRAGMPVFMNSGTGAIPSNTTVSVVLNDSLFRISNAPTTALSNFAVIRAERIWEHAWLNQTGHSKGSIGASASIQPGLVREDTAFHSLLNPAMGIYLYRSSNGSGTFSTTGAQIRWNYGAQGIKDEDFVDVRVFAVEMVNVPTATHYIDTATILSEQVIIIDGEGLNGANNRTFVDNSANNFTVSRFGNAAQGSFSPFCGAGGSVYFDGIGDYLSVPVNSALDLQGVDYTIEFWVNLNNITGQQTFISNYLSSTTGYAIQLSGGGVGVNLSGDGFDISGGALQPAIWYHIALSRSSTGHRLFINGTQVGSTFTGATVMNSTATTKVGYLGTSSTLMNGFISNLRVLKGTALYTSNFTPPTSPLGNITNTSLLLRFENAGIIEQRKRNNIGSGGSLNISTAQFKNGSGSIAFGASGDYLMIPDQENMDMGAVPFTWECWVFPNVAGNGTTRGIFCKRNSTGWYNGPVLWLNTNNTLTLYATFNNSSWGISGATSTATLTAGAWSHVALTWDGSNYRIYINGTQAISVANSNAMALNASNLFIGADAYGTAPLNGFMDDIRIVRGTCVYTTNFTPPAGPWNTSLTINGFGVTSESSFNVGGVGASDLQYGSSRPLIANDFNSNNAQTLPAQFPKGYNGFYCMKYEISQQQWVNYFNSLTTLQKGNMDITGSTGKNGDSIAFRNNIRWTSGDAVLNGGTHGAVSCNYLSWPDAAAYADWSGLRPMSELEFEKAARGTPLATMGEPSSGNTCNGFPDLYEAIGFSNSGATNEKASNSEATATFNNNAGVQGPLRSGAFADSATTRARAGAGYWGIMDLSGNLYELVVSLGNSSGRAFQASHGNGQLTVSGYADVTNWPGLSGAAITGAAGSGKRGGSWEDIAIRLRVSDRYFSNSSASTRDRSSGFRAVRSLPSSNVQ